MKRLEGKVALVTGATSGVGLATARCLRDEGAQVAITGRDRARLDEAAKGLGPTVVGLEGDVASVHDIEEIFLAVAEAARPTAALGSRTP